MNKRMLVVLLVSFGITACSSMPPSRTQLEAALQANPESGEFTPVDIERIKAQLDQGEYAHRK